MTDMPGPAGAATAPPIARDSPPSSMLPRALFGLGFVTNRRRALDLLVKTTGGCVSVRVPVFGDTVVVADPGLAKQVFTTSPEVLHNVQPNLSRVFGPGSVFALDGAEHRRRRKLLTPPFHGKSIAAYERIVEEETLREMANWPDGKEFATLEPMMRITLNVILRGVFGADGIELEQLRDVLPKWVTLASRLALLPIPKRPIGPWDPWGRLAGYRRTYESLVDTLITRARQDPRLEERTDILALFLRSRYDDGTAMTRGEIGDELLALLAAGHETTASTLGWTFERISRHPEILHRLVTEAHGDQNTYRQATILETQRVRTVIDLASRHVAVSDYELGPWSIPRGHTIMVSLRQLHENPDEFPEPDRFDPQRFIDNKPNAFSWVPFGGGTRRCAGAAFATMEMDVVLRTVLRNMTIQTTDKPDEKIHNRGVAFTPSRGGRIVVHRRSARHRPRSTRPDKSDQTA